MIESRVRPYIGGVLGMVGGMLARRGLRPDQLSVLGLGVTIAGSVFVALGRFVLGGALVLIGSAIDGLDGSVARARGSAGARGAFLDSVSDRVGETAMFGGVAFAVAGNGIFVALAVLSLGASLIISYLRAKAEGSGAEGRSGLMGRAERVILYSVGVIAGFPGPMLGLMTGLTWLTVVQRFVATWRQLDP